MALKQTIIDVLRDEFPDLVADGLESVRSTGRVTGVVISAGFQRLNHKQRQDRLWRILETHLTSQQLALVGPIATLTPADAELGATG